MAQQSQTPQKNDKPARTSPSADNILDYFKNHARETVSYIILLTGILLLTYWPFYGGLLVGIITGIYFADTIVSYIKGWKASIASSNYSTIARHVILLGLAIAFFISAPAIFIGAAIAIGIKQLFIS